MMKALVKTWSLILILFCIIIITGCSPHRAEIDSVEVNVNESTKEYTMKANGEKVNGDVIFYETDAITNKQYIKSIRKVREGKRFDVGYDYYANGTIYKEYMYDVNGLLTGTVRQYYENGLLNATAEYKDNEPDGSTKIFSPDGIILNEVLFEHGKKTKESVMKIGEKGVVLVGGENIDFVDVNSGFYAYHEIGRQSTIYQPLIIIALVNASSKAIDQTVKLEGIFFSGGKEWSRTTNFFQGFSDRPIGSGLSRKVLIKSNSGYDNFTKTLYSVDSCKVLINDRYFKTFHIESSLLSLKSIIPQ